MIHLIRINATEVCVFSNCEEVRLLQSSSGGSPKAETRKPDAGFSLKHPPFHFKIPAETTDLKAEGLIRGKIAATELWRTPGKPAKLTLTADRTRLTADGADISRIIVSATDAKGTEIPDCAEEVTFALEGAGQLIGENPVRLRAGKMIILAQSSFVPGSIKIRASSPGLAPAAVEVATTAVPTGVDMPATPPAKQPSSKRLIVKGGSAGTAKVQALSFSDKTDVAPDTWIESDPIMLDTSAALSITGGEYRIYTAPWTSKPGRAGGGDAVFVRLKSSPTPGGKVTAVLTVQKETVSFNVTTRR